MTEIDENDGFFRVRGFIGNISVTKSSRNHITIIVNGRVARNNKLIAAVYEAYEAGSPAAAIPSA